MKVLAKSQPPDGDTKAKLMAQFLALGWWDQMTIMEREAFFERGELLESPFAVNILFPLIQRSNNRPN